MRRARRYEGPRMRSLCAFIWRCYGRVVRFMDIMRAMTTIQIQSLPEPVEDTHMPECLHFQAPFSLGGRSLWWWEGTALGAQVFPLSVIRVLVIVGCRLLVNLCFVLLVVCGVCCRPDDAPARKRDAASASTRSQTMTTQASMTTRTAGACAPASSCQSACMRAFAQSWIFLHVRVRAAALGCLCVGAGPLEQALAGGSKRMGRGANGHCAVVSSCLVLCMGAATLSRAPSRFVCVQ